MGAKGAVIKKVAGGIVNKIKSMRSTAKGKAILKKTKDAYDKSGKKPTQKGLTAGEKAALVKKGYKSANNPPKGKLVSDSDFKKMKAARTVSEGNAARKASSKAKSDAAFDKRQAARREKATEIQRVGGTMGKRTSRELPTKPTKKPIEGSGSVKAKKAAKPKGLTELRGWGSMGKRRPPRKPPRRK